MQLEKIKQEINQLGLSEKLLLIEDVWDSIAQTNKELPMPEWQKKELDLRYKLYKTDRQNLYDWESVHKDLRNKYK